MQNTIKYTTVLPVDHIEELKAMTAKKQIASVNQGIRLAIEQYIEQERKKIYASEMQAAAQDADFMSRTLEAQETFALVDAEEMGEW